MSNETEVLKFHTHDGVTFTRIPGAGVAIYFPASAKRDHFLTPEQWASVVANVSNITEAMDRRRFYDALAFHGAPTNR